MTSAPDTTTLPAKMQSPASSTPVPLSTAKQLKRECNYVQASS